MKTKILILGSTGMLGHMVKRVLSDTKYFYVEGTHLRNKGDLYYFNVLEGIKKINLIWEKNKGFAYIINCIGITKDKINESDSDSIVKAIKINSLFPHYLAEFCRDKEVRIINISTDGVFSGLAESYLEDSFHDCVDVYGKTKSLGEVLDKHFLNIRCSILGPSPFEKRGLFEWFSAQPEGSKVYGYTNHLWNGVTTLQFAELCRKIIKDSKFDTLREESAVFHFAPNKPLTKFELLNCLKVVLNKKIIIVPKKNKGGRISRVMLSKYSGIKKIYKQNISMKDALLKLVGFYYRKG